jgi:pimeloyl-ACP methyl ester carboxylesterase
MSTTATTTTTTATTTTTSQYLELEEGTLAYTDYGGNGDLVVMLPGMGALKEEYRFLAPALVTAGYHAVAADLRGQGASSVFSKPAKYDVPSVGRDILALIDHLVAVGAGAGGAGDRISNDTTKDNNKKSGGAAHVVGTSFSPASCVWASVEAPTKIKSLTLIGAFCRDPKTNPFMKGVLWMMFAGPWRVQAWKAFYPTLFPTQKPDDFDDYMKQLQATLQGKGRFTAVAAYASATKAACEERLPQVRKPTLVVMGTADPDFSNPRAEADFIVSAIPGAKLSMIEGGGHYPQSEFPDQTTTAILDFLNSLKDDDEDDDGEA